MRRKLIEEDEGDANTENLFHQTSPARTLWVRSSEAGSHDPDIRCEHANDQSKCEAGYASTCNQAAEASDVAANPEICSPAKIKYKARQTLQQDSEYPLQAFQAGYASTGNQTAEASDVATNPEICSPAKIKYKAKQTLNEDSEYPLQAFQAAAFAPPTPECEGVSHAAPGLEPSITIRKSPDLPESVPNQMLVRTDLVQQYESGRVITECQSPLTARVAWESTSLDTPFTKQYVESNFELLGHLCRHLAHARGGLFIFVCSLCWRPCHDNMETKSFVHSDMSSPASVSPATSASPGERKTSQDDSGIRIRARRFPIITLSVRFEHSWKALILLLYLGPSSINSLVTIIIWLQTLIALVAVPTLPR